MATDNKVMADAIQGGITYEFEDGTRFTTPQTREQKLARLLQTAEDFRDELARMLDQERG